MVDLIDFKIFAGSRTPATPIPSTSRRALPRSGPRPSDPLVSPFSRPYRQPAVKYLIYDEDECSWVDSEGESWYVYSSFDHDDYAEPALCMTHCGHTSADFSPTCSCSHASFANPSECSLSCGHSLSDFPCSHSAADFPCGHTAFSFFDFRDDRTWQVGNQTLTWRFFDHALHLFWEGAWRQVPTTSY